MSLAEGARAVPVPSLALVILDGWGLAPEGAGNAIAQADTPTFDELWSRYPHTSCRRRGRDVGLPDGQMGNSEVGHLNLGAGSVVKQDLARLDEAVADGSFFSNEVLVGACRAARESPRGRLHLVGLVSDGGVHSGWVHIQGLIELAARAEVPDLVVHAFTDGRDTLPDSAPATSSQVEGWLRQGARRHGRRPLLREWTATATGSGRSWPTTRSSTPTARGPTRPRRPSRPPTATARPTSSSSPTVVGDYDGMADGDVAIHFNFRPDRARQLCRALGEEGFEEFDRGESPDVALSTLTSYQDGWEYPVAFSPARPETTLAAVLAERGDRQLHVAETEKYAHVTYFFNGGREQEWEGEERCLVDSPRDVPTYDHKPEMSAAAAAEAFASRWREGGYRFGIINFANPDMVGHTGDIPAAVQGVEAVDACLADVVAAVHGVGGACVVTADHGNADNMLEPDGSPNTAHSTNPVPFIVTVSGLELGDGGVLADVAPTALALLGIPQPEAMTGRSLAST